MQSGIKAKKIRAFAQERKLARWAAVEEISLPELGGIGCQKSLELGRERPH